MSERIHQEVTYAAAPEEVYAVLTEAERFSAMSGGAPTDIDATAGGAFSCFGGMIEGRNIECEPGSRLVQAWRAKTWDPGVFSIVKFELFEEEGATRVTLEHAGFPQGQADHLAAGWKANYWEPMERLLSNH